MWRKKKHFSTAKLAKQYIPQFHWGAFPTLLRSVLRRFRGVYEYPIFFTVWGLKYQVLYVTLVHKDLGGPSYHSISEQLRFHCAVLSGMLDQPFLSNTLQDNGWSYPHSDWVCLFLLNRFRVDGRFIYACLFPRGFNTVHRSFYWELLRLRIEIQTFHILSSR